MTKTVRVVIEKTQDALDLEEKHGIDLGLKQGYDHDAGYDVKACIPTSVVIKAGATEIFPTGLKMQLSSPDWEIQARSRSGLAAGAHIMVLNSPGTIDYGYRGEIKIILHNTSRESFLVNTGDRIAQLCFREVPGVIIKYGKLDSSERGEGGLGSTGVQ